MYLTKYKKNIADILMILIFGIVTFCAAFHHEIWSDEGQVWLLAKNAGFFNMLDHARVEGHPALWYLLVFPLAKLNFSVFSMQVLAWFLNFCGGAFFVLKAPFNRLCKYTFLFSMGMVYWNGTLARSYSLLPLLIFLLAGFYQKRKTSPVLYCGLLILLSQVHVIMYGFCAVLIGVYCYEIYKEKLYFNRKILLCTGLVLTNLFVIFILIAVMYGVNPVIDTYVSSNIMLCKDLVSQVFGSRNICFALLLFFSVFSFALFLFRADKKIFLIFTASWLYEFLIYKFVWGMIPQRTFSLILILLFCFWAVFESGTIKDGSKKIVNLLFSLIFIFSFPSSFDYLTQEYSKNYSDSKNAAKFIESNMPPDAVLFLSNGFITQGLNAYIPERKFIFLRTGSYHSYAVWVYKNVIKVSPAEVEGKEAYLITNTKNPDLGLTPVYSTNEKDLMSNGEKFVIYRLR